jgi:cyclase
MLPPRVIPCLLLRNQGLVKTVGFKNPRYLGDPINVVRIFNDKEVDELVFLDILAARERRSPPFELISQIASECFMPLCYGGGVRTIPDIRRLLAIGIEKVAVNSFAHERPSFIREAADLFGSSSVIVSIDVKKRRFGGKEVVTNGGERWTGIDPVAFAVEMERQGAGELLLNSVDRDGSMTGYDLELVKQVSTAVSIPVIACGGAGSINDLGSAITFGGASAAAAGSLFVFHGPHRAVLITYPSPAELQALNLGVEYAS